MLNLEDGVVSLLEGNRKDQTDPFGLKLLPLERLDPVTLECVQAFLGPFHHFDDYQLETLIRYKAGADDETPG